MDSTLQWTLLSLMTAIGGGFMWFIRNTITDQKEKTEYLERAVQRVREEYLHKNEFKEWKGELKELLEEIKKDVRAIRNEKD